MTDEESPCPYCGDTGIISYLHPRRGKYVTDYCDCEAGEQKRDYDEQQRDEAAKADYEDMKYQRWKDRGL